MRGGEWCVGCVASSLVLVLDAALGELIRRDRPQTKRESVEGRETTAVYSSSPCLVADAFVPIL